MIDKDSLCEFLVEAKKSTYASSDLANESAELDKSTSLFFQKWDWKYHDNYFWWEPYGGREVVFYNEQPVYIMTYYWSVIEEISDLKHVYKFLQEALRLIPRGNPFRGPKEYKKDNMVYINNFVWEINNFSGEEKILEDGKEIYSARYMGGFVDQKRNNL